MVHSFHIHVNQFLVIAVNGKAVQPTWYDVIPVTQKGSVTMLMVFQDFVGLFPTHCHIVDHEDLGMMANVFITAKGAPGPAPVNPQEDDDSALRYVTADGKDPSPPPP